MESAVVLPSISQTVIKYESVKSAQGEDGGLRGSVEMQKESPVTSGCDDQIPPHESRVNIA